MVQRLHAAIENLQRLHAPVIASVHGAVAGFGLGLVVPAMTAALLGSVEPARSGVAAGMLNTARQAGSVLGVGVFGALAAGSLETGLHAALLISTGIAVALAALSRRLRTR